LEPHSETTLIPLLIVSILAFIIPILTAWLSKTIKLPIPAIVGEIICGIIIGSSLLEIIPNTETIPWLKFLALFGFTYLMFLSGLEIDFGIILSGSALNKIKLIKRTFLHKPLSQALMHFLITLALSSALSLILFQQGFINNWLMMSLILSTTSVSVVVPIIKEKLLAKTQYGQTILLSALSADFLTMVLITILVASHTNSAGGETLLIIFLMLILIFAVYKLHISKGFDKIINKLSVLTPILSDLVHATTQIKVRGAIALMILFIVMSELLGFEVILGAFLAGILTTLILGKAKTVQLEMKLDAIGYGFFIPIFFISVGIDIDLNVFFQSEKAWFLLILLITSAFAIKILPALIFRFNYNLRESLSAGILLSARLSLIIAASTIGLKEGMISEEVNAAIVMVAVITCIASPIIFNHLFKTQLTTSKEKIGIIGASQLGITIAEKLLEQRQNVIISAISFQEYNQVNKQGLPLVHGGSAIEETIKNIGISEIKTLIAATDIDEFNLSICCYARDNYGVNNLLSIANDHEKIYLYEQQKIDPICCTTSVAESIMNKIISPDAFALFSRKDDQIRIADVWLTNDNYNNVTLNSIQLPGDSMVIHIMRENEHIVPHGVTVIQANDHLTLIGTPKSVEESVNLIGMPPDQYCPLPLPKSR